MSEDITIKSMSLLPVLGTIGVSSLVSPDVDDAARTLFVVVEYPRVLADAPAIPVPWPYHPRGYET